MASTAIDEFFISIGIDPIEAEKGISRLDKSLSAGLNSIDKGASRLASKMPADFTKGLGKTEEAFKRASSNISNVLKSMFAPIAAIFGLSRAFSDYTSQADAVGKLSTELGVNGEKLQMWGEAAKRAGGTAEGLQGSIRALRSNLAQFKMTGQSGLMLPLARMGIDMNSLRGDSFEVLRSLASKMEGMSHDRAMRLGKTLGLDAGTIGLLQKGSKEIDALITRQKELGVYTKRDMETAEKWRNALYDLQQVFQSASAIIMRVVVPPLKYVADLLTDGIIFLRQHEPFLIALVTGIAAALSLTLLPAIGKVLAALAPMLTAFAPIAAAALLFDDLWTYAQGGESALSDLWSQFGTGEQIMAGLTAAWEDVKDALGLIMDKLKAGLAYLFDGLSPLLPVFAPIVDAVKSIYSALSELSGLIGSIWSLITDLGAAFLALFTDADPSSTTEKVSLLKAAVELVAIGIKGLADGIKFLFDGLGWAIGKVREGLDWLKSLDLSNLFDFQWPDFSHLFDSLTLPDLSGLFDFQWPDLSHVFDSLRLPDLSGLFDFQWPDFSHLFDSFKLPDFSGLFDSFKLPDLSAIFDPDRVDMSALQRAMTAPFESLLGLLEKVKNFSVSDTLAGWGDSIKTWWQGVIDSIKQTWDNFVSGLADLVPDWLKKPLGIKTDDDKKRETAISAAVGGKSKDEYVQAKVQELKGAGVSEQDAATAAAKEYDATTAQAATAFDKTATQKKVDDISAQVEANKRAANLDDLWASFGSTFGAPAEALPVSAAAGNQTSTVTQDTQVNIGQVNVQTQATDAQGVANGFVQGVNDATMRNGLIIPANSGVRR